MMAAMGIMIHIGLALAIAWRGSVTQFLAALLAAQLAWWVARHCDVPVWQNWTAPDAADYALIAFMLTWVAIAAVRGHG